jgi:hypothetical protein
MASHRPKILDHNRLSLQTVRWFNPVIAVILAVTTAILVFAPSLMIHTALRTGNVPSLHALSLAFTFGVGLSIVGFGYVFPGAAAIWGIPALIVTYVALWLRLRFVAFVIAGALTAVFGLAIIAAREQRLPDVLDSALHNAGVLLRNPLLLTEWARLNAGPMICGAAGSAVAWGYLRLSRRRFDADGKPIPYWQEQEIWPDLSEVSMPWPPAFAEPLRFELPIAAIKRTVLAYALWTVAGTLGAHRFYMKRRGARVLLALGTLQALGAALLFHGVTIWMWLPYAAAQNVTLTSALALNPSMMQFVNPIEVGVLWVLTLPAFGATLWVLADAFRLPGWLRQQQQASPS